MRTPHLTDEQFGELLAGNTTDLAAMQHVEACATCRNELDSIGSTLGDVRDLSLRWAEERAARIHPPSLWALRWHAVPGWSVAAAALLICGIAIGNAALTRGQSAPQVSQLSHRDEAAPSDDVLAQDNRLLRSINDELQQQIRPQVPASDLAPSSRSGRSGIPSEVVN